MRQLLIAVVLVSVLFSCGTPERHTYKPDYGVKIDYLNLPTSDMREMVNDSLIIVFYGSFVEDTFSVMINQKHFKDLILTTDERTGWSGDLKTIKYKDVESIGIRINNGNLIYIEPPRRHYNIQLLYLDDVATVSFHRRLPV
nr:hypothetical protein [uncultured Draconibacterium sp.]